MQSDRQAMNVQRSADMDDDWDVFGDDRRADAGWNRGTNTGFVPLDFATGVTAGAVGTAGAIAGGVAGNAIEKNMDKTWHEVTIRMDDGRTVVLSQDDLNGVREGSRVIVRNGRAQLN